MNVLVTGATGFLGRYVVAEALRRGHRVYALVRPAQPEAGPWCDHPRLERVRGDLRHPAGLGAALRGVDAVLHLAAAKSGDLYAQLGGTVVATENLLSAMDCASVGRIVAVSSFSVYDYRRARRSRALDESSALEARPRCRDAYAQTTLWQERLVREYAETRGWSWTILRPGVIYGKDNLWTARLGARLGDRFWMRIGQSARLPLVYVEHCAEAVVRTAESEAAAAHVLNVVDDNPPTQGRYAALLRRRLALRPRVLVVPRLAVRLLASAATTTNALVFQGRAKIPGLLVTARFDARFRPLAYDNRRIKQVLGWAPRYSLEEALTRSFEMDEAELLTLRPDDEQIPRPGLPLG
jgi:nucleoside-diphosphate-sugar epimerase